MTIFFDELIAFGFFATAQATKCLLEIVWTHNVYTMNIAGDDQATQRLLNAGTAEAIAAKLKERGAKLPFKLKTF